ncbi:hypothetical protein [Nocardioides sp. Kera G14]|uniref:hypothetical protein n=1 Tax=Nocardioides sp. Kera G14 TaxID=2884264 RepID=UPI001D11571E|nr:hypothetical protein [Nocardioides sp. Kera G14]UDY25166.1 hypothetical protein LH076_07720 [Nocardioides sp. Kera G14]
MTTHTHVPVRVSVALFTVDWTYLGTRMSTRGGVFRFNHLPAGTYRLQATDVRPAWNVKKLARTDATVAVGSGAAVERDIVMGKGAFVTGTVRVGRGHGTAGRRATIAVASEYGASYTTVADKRGRFAVAGLPGGQSYSVFTWDKRARWTGRSIWLGRLKAGKGRNLHVRLKTASGSYAGILRVGGTPANGTIWATVVSRANGQWWTAPIVNGDLSRFRGLYPGAYVLKLPRTSQMPAQDLALPVVRSGRTTLARVDARPARAPSVSPSASPSASPSVSPSVSPSASASATASATAEGSPIS